MIALAALAFGQHEPERINTRRPAKNSNHLGTGSAASFIHDFQHRETI